MKRAELDLRKVVGKSTLGEADRITDVISWMDDMGSIIAEQNETHQIMCMDPVYLIPELNVIACPMCDLEWNENENDYEADWCGTAILKENEGYLDLEYYEQDPIITTLCNFTEKSIQEIISARCLIARGIENLIRPCIIVDNINEADAEEYNA